MNAEVEVVREQCITYVVVGIKSLEEAERIALDHAERKLAMSTKVAARKTKKAEHYVQWSNPVIVHEGQVLREKK